jgi:hypothetical protein
VLRIPYRITGTAPKTGAARPPKKPLTCKNTPRLQRRGIGRPARPALSTRRRPRLGRDRLVGHPHPPPTIFVVIIAGDRERPMHTRRNNAPYIGRNALRTSRGRACGKPPVPASVRD